MDCVGFLALRKILPGILCVMFFPKFTLKYYWSVYNVTRRYILRRQLLSFIERELVFIFIYLLRCSFKL
jgi:hypothetical protein